MLLRVCLGEGLRAVPAGQVPEIYHALTTELTLDGRTRTITFETAQPVGDSIVRAISLQQTSYLQLS